MSDDRLQIDRFIGPVYREPCHGGGGCTPGRCPHPRCRNACKTFYFCTPDTTYRRVLRKSSRPGIDLDAEAWQVWDWEKAGRPLIVPAHGRVIFCWEPIHTLTPPKEPAE
jgi:hypothetical protein